jgi:hypothetical protein
MFPYAGNIPIGTTFVVKNITSAPGRIINVFQTQIYPGMSLDLMQVRGVGEDDIREALLKGSLGQHIKNSQLQVTSSTIRFSEQDPTFVAFLNTYGLGSNIAGAPNYVSSTNTNALSAAYPLVFTASSITRKGSGLFEVSASGCPVITFGGGIVISFALWRDYGTGSAVQLGIGSQPIVRKIAASGAGTDAEGAITPFVDVVTDYNAHAYSIVMTNGSTINMSDGAGHCVIMVKEL